MRTMWDSVTATSIPRGVGMVAGYVDGRYAWSQRDWDMFSAAIRVRIAVFPSTNDGHVLDVEPGNAMPGDTRIGEWVKRRRAAGVEPTIYTMRSLWGDLIRNFNQWGIAQPQWWIAEWNSRATMIDGAIAHQYKHGDIHLGREHYSGGHYDLNVVGDYWPGVDGPKPPGGGGGNVPAWPLPAGHYFGPIWGPNESHGGYHQSEKGHIREIQLRLCARGFARRNNGNAVTDPNGWSDGTYGQATVDAMKRAQASWGYHQTGNVWPDDWRRLFS